MKYFLTFLTALLFISGAKAQSGADSVKQTINTLFEAMKNSDPDQLQSVFADSAILQSVSVNKEGKTVVENQLVSVFAATVKKLPKGDADERIVFDIVKIDGPLAMVWAPYKFYYKGNFSHCGVDSFQLIRVNGVWKILYLIDTRTKKGCE
jgi:hypothetical protein